MKKAVAVGLCAATVLTCTLGGCGSVRNNNKPVENVETTTSFEELMSYYDNLAKGDISVEVMTTNVRGLYTVEGDVRQLPDGVFENMVAIIERCYKKLYYEYSSNYSAPQLTLAIDPTYSRGDANYVVGNTIVINPNWFISHPEDYDSIILGMMKVALKYPNSVPEWINSSVCYYGRDEYALYNGESGNALSGRYTGGSYKDGGEVGASFFKWISKSMNKNIAALLTTDIYNKNKYNEKFWLEQTGKSLDELWVDYKASGTK